MNTIDKKSIETLKLIGVEAINKANSGHPGIVLGFGKTLYYLFKNHLNYNPIDPKWINRDRFLLSAGHGSALLYSALHFFTNSLTIEDLKDFRQIGSKTPGHPESHLTDFVEMTTGPLGQGISNAVGLAISEKNLSAKYNSISHNTYVVVGDGDLQEGLSFEALSIAAKLNLNKLIVLFDSNDVQLDTMTSLTTSIDYKKYCESLGINYILVKKNSSAEINKSLELAKANKNGPTFIEFKTIIGYQATKQNSPAVHGSPIGDDIINLYDKIGLKNREPFSVEKEVHNNFKQIKQSKLEHANKWKIDSKLKKDINLFNDFDLKNIEFNFKKNDATRNITGEILNKIQAKYSNLLVGSADLTGSTKIKGMHGDFTNENPLGNNINYGVREGAMGSINNGINNYHRSLVKSVASTFLVFSDYLKPALRLSALSEIPSIFVFSHDSIFVGEDGPTHQPIEHLSLMRSIPNFNLFRPCDKNESMAAFQVAFKSNDFPTAILTTRQNLNDVEQTSYEKAQKGAYILLQNSNNPEIVIMASGSEVQLAIEIYQILIGKNIKARIVSIPSDFIFDKQQKKYKESVINNNSYLAIIEAANSSNLLKYTKGHNFDVFDINTYGESGVGIEVYKHLGFDAKKIAKKIINNYNKEN